MPIVTSSGAVVGTTDPVVSSNVVVNGGVAIRQSDQAMYISLVNTSQSGVLIAGLGDSIMLQSSSSALLQTSSGCLPWACAHSGQRLVFTHAMNFGVNGDTSTLCLARTATAVAAMAAAGARFCVVNIGTNDLLAGISAATSIANATAILALVSAAGIVPVYTPILPRDTNGSGGSLTTAQRQYFQYINNQMRQLCNSHSFYRVADPTLNIADHTLTNGSPIGASTAAATAYTHDGLHPSVRAAFFWGQAIADCLQYDLRGISQSLWSQIDTYDATNNPSGNLIPTGFMTGTSGTKGTGASGNVADNWTVQRAAGTTGTVVGSKGTVTNTNGTTYPTQILTCAAIAGSATETFQMYQQIFSNFAAGDIVFAECDISVSGIGTDSLTELMLKCADDFSDARCMQADTGWFYPNVSWANRTLRTFPFAVGSSPTNLVCMIQIGLDGTVASNGVVVTVSRCVLKKVV